MEKYKVLFVFPNTYLNIGIPQGIAILSACLKEAGFETDLFDFTFVKTEEVERDEEHQNFLPTEYTLYDLVKDDPIVSMDEMFRNKIEDFKPDLIAVSVMSSTYDDGVKLLRNNRDCFNCPVVFGGVHATLDPRDTLNNDIVNYAIVGEGDQVIVDLANCLSRELDPSNLDNLAYRDNDGNIVVNKLRSFVDLDTLPCPDWSIFDKRHFFRPFMGKIYTGSFYTMSRGCPYACNYCVNSTLKVIQKDCGRYFRLQSAKKTISDLRQLKEKYGVNWIKFADDSIMSMNIEYLKELRDGLKELDIMFGCSVRPETTTDEKVSILKDMGCVAMSVGIESGNEELRKVQLGRRMSNEQIINAIKIMNDHDIRVSTFNMVGLPGEKRENVFETIELNRKLKVSSCNCYVVYPYPGTPIAIKYQTSYRNDSGEFIAVEEASRFHLSEMNPEEVDGLQKTFNLYLHLPKELWPVIELAEKNDDDAKVILNSLNEFTDKCYL